MLHNLNKISDWFKLNFDPSCDYNLDPQVQRWYNIINIPVRIGLSKIGFIAASKWLVFKVEVLSVVL